MALKLPLNEISQPNLSEKELVVVIISKNIKYYSITYIAPYNTNLKEPEMLYRSLVGFEKARGCGGFFCVCFNILEILPPPLCFSCRDDICDYQGRQECCSNERKPEAKI